MSDAKRSRLDTPETIADRVNALAKALDKTPADFHAALPHLKGGASAPASVEVGPLGDYIDHTVLKATTTVKDVEKLCAEAVQHKFKAVCVNGSMVAEAVKALGDSGVLVASVVGFPLGAMDPAAKAGETKAACAAGAKEIDMVLQVGRLLSGEYAYVLDDIRRVVNAAKPSGAIVKVILETCYLEDEHIIDACLLCGLAGAHFVKTSTGFGTPAPGRATGATLPHVKLMKSVVGSSLQVKASGGVRDKAAAVEYIEAGTNRIGTSSGAAIVAGGTTSGY